MLASHSLPSQKRLIAALVTFYSLKAIAVVTIVLICLIVLLYVLSVLLSALLEVCTQIAQMWNVSDPLEKMLFLTLAWICIAWVACTYRRWHHARI